MDDKGLSQCHFLNLTQHILRVRLSVKTIREVIYG
jgi:hypothetical protein